MPRSSSKPKATRVSSPRLRFFLGKGGVGKTTCAAACALALAESGRRVLLLETDGTHALAELLGEKLTGNPTPIAITRKGALSAATIDEERALSRWILRHKRTLSIAAKRGSRLDDDDLERLFRLSFSGVGHVVGLLEVMRLAQEKPYDDVVIDMAAAGGTHGLFDTPQALRRIASVFDDMATKHRLASKRPGHRYVRETEDFAIEEIDREARALFQILRSPARTDITWVLIPEALSLADSLHQIAELRASGLPIAELVVNRVLPPNDARCSSCVTTVRAQRNVIRTLLRELGDLPMRLISAAKRDPREDSILPAIGRALLAKTRGDRLFDAPLRAVTKRRAAVSSTRKIALELPRQTSLLVISGEGGVGKTTCSAALSIALAASKPPRRVLLLGTDTSCSLGHVLDSPLTDRDQSLHDAPPRLRARQLDPERALEAFRASYDAAIESLSPHAKADFENDRAILHALFELAPPGFDHLLALHALSDATSKTPRKRARYDLVLLDAPSSSSMAHLLALSDRAIEWLEMLITIAGKYGSKRALRDLTRALTDVAKKIRDLATLLRDGERTKQIQIVRTSNDCACHDRVSAPEPRAKSSIANRSSLESSSLPTGPRGVVALRAFAEAWEITTR